MRKTKINRKKFMTFEKLSEFSVFLNTNQYINVLTDEGFYILIYWAFEVETKAKVK